MTPIAVAGADGTLGRLFVERLGAQGVVIRSPGAVAPPEVMDLARARVVVNVAGPRARPGLGWPDYLREHVGTTLAVARSLAPGAHLIHFSSSAVLGGHRGMVLDGDSPESPLTFPNPAYAYAKLAAETAARAVARERGVDVTVLRSPLAYGPGLTGFTDSLLRLARKGLRLHLTPAALRHHFIHIDVLVAFVRALAGRGPCARRVLVPADPFVLSNADLARAVDTAGRGLGVPVPLPFFEWVVEHWPGYPSRLAPPTLEAFAALGTDNEYDWQQAFAAAGVDPQPFTRERLWDAHLAVGRVSA